MQLEMDYYQEAKNILGTEATKYLPNIYHFDSKCTGVSVSVVFIPVGGDNNLTYTRFLVLFCLYYIRKTNGRHYGILGRV